MEKLKTRFVCQSCGYASLRWLGRCPSCEQWDSMVEEVIREDRSGKAGATPESAVYSLSEINTNKAERVQIGINEFDRLLGGGIIPGSIILLGGEPGIGKSTLLLQVACNLADRGISTLYVTGEESLEQTKLRAKRIGLSGDSLYLLNETNTDVIINHIDKNKPKVVIIDSIQILYLSEITSAPGSVAQVRECAGRLTSEAKRRNVTIFLIGHVTKTGAIAGPRVVEHLVDTVLYFEGDMHNRYRILRTLKNRFGSTEEIGIFNMQADGLHEVENPSEIFLNPRGNPISGSVVTASIEGTRPILVELQALVAPTIFGMPERRTIGLDYRRLAILLAVLEKRAGLRLENQDVFVNVVGGIKLNEPAVDLGAAVAIVSSFRDIPVPEWTVVVGEIGLGGEVRPVNYIDRRLSEIERLGFKRIILPKKNLDQVSGAKKIKLTGVDTITEAVEELFGKSKSFQRSCAQ